ncbi:helix-turn-helix domain-containing protein [Streptomyces sp. BI20]|uniref:helix-turn-helix domain-containing protein n=1 Tax=Streptomyces sp. BI20 TaxID=3403460 RepID=UPI003C7543BE
MTEVRQQPTLNPLSDFGLDVRQMRETRGMSLRALGHATGYSESYVCKVEKGVLAASEQFVQGCDVAFTTGTLFHRKWLRSREGDHPSWFAPYLTLERQASEIWDFSTMFVMGLLQTEEYAHATLKAANPRDNQSALDGRVQSRLSRHVVLQRQDPPELWVILHEACLRTAVGGAEVMRQQIDHLISAAGDPNITLQLLPFAAGAPTNGAPYTMLFFSESGTVVYSEGPQGGRPYDDPKVVKHSTQMYQRLRMLALPHDDSVARMKDIHKEFRA